jgi:ABC-type uncharacterized transport system substrate-binding protein
MSVIALLLRWLVCVVCGVSLAGVALGATVVIVTTDRSAGYAEAADAVAEQFRRNNVPRSEIMQFTAQEFAALLEQAPVAPRIYVTLGAEGLTRVLARESRVPVVASLIPRVSFERIARELGRSASALLSAVYLDQPLGRQLDLLKLALPSAKRVGVLWGSESIAQQPGLLVAARARGLEISSAAPLGGPTIFSGLKDTLDSSDVLLAMADPQVFNGNTLPNILLASYRARIPVMAFSPAYVKAGALLSLHSTPSQVGSQAGVVARSALQGAALPAPQYPTDFTVSVNDYVARSLGLGLDATTLSERLHSLEKRP